MEKEPKVQPLRSVDDVKSDHTFSKDWVIMRITKISPDHRERFGEVIAHGEENDMIKRLASIKTAVLVEQDRKEHYAFFRAGSHTTKD